LGAGLQTDWNRASRHENDGERPSPDSPSRTTQKCPILGHFSVRAIRRENPLRRAVHPHDLLVDHRACHFRQRRPATANLLRVWSCAENPVDFLGQVAGDRFPNSLAPVLQENLLFAALLVMMPGERLFSQELSGFLGGSLACCPGVN